MFVVPSVVEPVSLAQRNRIEEAVRVYESFTGGVDNHDLVEQPRFEEKKKVKKKKSSSKKKK